MHVCSNSLKSLSQLKTKFTWDHHGIGEKIYSNDSGQLLFFILIYFNFVSPRGAGAYSGDFTTNYARQCRAFSRALKIGKLKAQLFRGPEGAGATNDWCITPRTLHREVQGSNPVRFFLFILCFFSFIFFFICFFGLEV